MYRKAHETINQGLGLGARLILGLVSALFGGVMLMAAGPGDKASYLFGAFCLSITVACFTTGRVRQFAGSVIGSAVLVVAVAYLVAEVKGGVVWSGRRSEPSVLNAVLFLLAFGIPGGGYAYKARFGWRRRRPAGTGSGTRSPNSS